MKKNNKTKNILIIIITALLVFGAVFSVGLFQNSKKETQGSIDIFTPVEEAKKVQPERNLWLSNKDINPDYVGEIKFDSGLIEKSFVQATDVYDNNGDLYHFYTENGALVTNGENYNGNDVYIWTNWKDMTYDYNILGGSVFMDYRNHLSDQNIIIYGHHFSEAGGNDPERIKAFTPLEKLLDEENFKNNNKVKMILDNETRSYELAYVYKFDIADEFHLDNLQYYRTEYNYDEFEDISDDNYYQNYIDACEKVKLYDTGVSLTTDDKTLTLQTCISGLAGSVYEICVFKQVNIEYYD